jgi:FAD/FMN-containing dehydrogenase
MQPTLSAATTFVHRGDQFLLEYTATSDPVQSAATPRTASEWLGQVRELLYEHGTCRAYQNFANPELADPLHACYGEHLPRLRNVKARYDPDDFFHHEQSIPPIHEE